MYISIKFCQFIASIYPHMLTSFGRFNLIFNKMALIFPRSTYRFLPFQVSSFNKSDWLDFIANDDETFGECQFTKPQFTGLSGLGEMLES